MCRQPRDLRLAAELALRTDFACNARDFRCETIKLIDHRIDGVFQLQDFALHLDGNLTTQVARATAVVTSAILRTWDVRLLAMELTLSVKSFQVPATPRTWA